MKTKTLILNLALLAALPVAATETTLQYHLTGEMQLNMQQDIYVGARSEAIGERDLSITFDMADAGNDNTLLVKLASISASYTAHGMKQRLPASHLNGEEFRLLGDGRTFMSQKGGGEVPLGTITDGGLRPSELLAGLLPELPGGPVFVGTTWKTDRIILSLEGWAWASGEMRHHHAVTDIQFSDGHTIVTVRTSGESRIDAADGHEGFIGLGTLTQRVDWTFDADSGQLLSLTDTRAATGTNRLPQGEIPIRQVARFELLTLL
jgi:hypothetical protein